MPVTPEPDGTGAAVIRVRDTGPGIADADLPRLYERFYRGDPSRSQPGAGLGLSLARAVARAHGGDLTVATSPAGSTFIARLMTQCGIDRLTFTSR